MNRIPWTGNNAVAVGLAFLLFGGTDAHAAGLADHGIQWPAWADILRVLTFQDYNTRVVVLGATLLGLAAGLVGTFLILRKRALLSDTLSHATLPGIALAFMIVSALGGDGKGLPGLLIGAAIFSVIGTGSVMVIQRFSRIKEDAALGIVLSVFFGLGVALMGMATRMGTGNAAGLDAFIYGKTASMLFQDALLIGLTALGVTIFCLAFFKEFELVCFDDGFAATQGWPVERLDFLMMALVVLVTVIGLQAVGLILVVALLIIPPAAARFWTHRLPVMLLLSGGFGAVSGMVGSALSALMVNLPSGAVIVLTASALFFFSLTLGTDRGLLQMLGRRRNLRKQVARENLLRAFFELDEAAPSEKTEQDFETLLDVRSWSPSRLRRTLDRLKSQGLVFGENGRFRLTKAGRREAASVVRKHRLWEAYLIAHADVAPGHVDWGADQIEHVLDAEMIRQLERRIPELIGMAVPRNPHAEPRLEN